MVTNNISLFNGDSLEIMKTLDIKVDAIITDPPYNISKKNNFSTLTNAKRHGLDFGVWDKDFDLFSWIDIADKLLKNGGNIVIFNSFLNIGNIAKYLELKGYAIKDLIRWVKSNPMPRNMKSRYASDYELAIWCVKGNKKWCFNNRTSKYLRPEIVCPVVGGREKVKHPTQKPVRLMEEIIKVLSNENDLILDPFTGSGSTGIACKNLNRKFVGIELEKKYFQIAKQRILDDIL